ncbi:Nudix family hydrolase [Pelomicrobium sp.]|uniref:Nudix family hydrolase n=1 Tax=Pelomicrobium sp. TaxID=2815319 RepID=UPI002FDDF9AD
MSIVSKHRPVVDVAVAVIQRADGRVLLAERPHGKVSAGYWEFPGGKFNAGENPEQALARELQEELDIKLDRAHPWLTYEHEYPDKRVRLHFFRVTAWHGTPRGREGQRISWEDPEIPEVAPLLPANALMLRALRLPRLYAITNAQKYGVVGFLERLERALERGVRLILVRERKFAPGQLTQFARRVIAMAHRYDAKVLVYGDETLARQVVSDGVHLTASQLPGLIERPRDLLCAASCHNATELAWASALSVDFVVLSPVLPTKSHPGEPGIGWDKFAELVRGYPLPVYALGGMRLELLDTAMRHGAHGIAMQSEIW